MKIRTAIVFLVFAWILTGCTGEKPQGATPAKHDHSEWWCDEHGIPEEECVRCHTELAKKHKDKGDWCDKHNRPDSQCFICHPEKEAEFAARYETKYGKKPPKRTEE